MKGNNYEDPDSFWDVSMTGNHVRSKSQPRSAPGSDSLKRKRDPMNPVPRRHTLGGSAFLPPDELPLNGNHVSFYFSFSLFSLSKGNTMLPVSLDCPFLIAPSVFSSVYM